MNVAEALGSEFKDYMFNKERAFITAVSKNDYLEVLKAFSQGAC